LSKHSLGTDNKRSAPPLIFEGGSPGRSGFFWPEDKKTDWIPSQFVRDEIAGFPELGELEVLRHFTCLVLKGLRDVAEKLFDPI